MAHTVNQVFLEFTSIINYVHFILLTTYFIVCSHVIFPVQTLPAINNEVCLPCFPVGPADCDSDTAPCYVT